MKIGFIGIGFVGGTTANVLEKKHEIIRYDIDIKKGFTDPSNLKNAEGVFICVPTPMKPSGEIDYSPMHNSLKTLTNVTSKNKEKPLVIIRSTAVSGTTDKLEEEYPFNFVFNPEFLREAHALEDMLNTDRIVIGANRLEDFKKTKKIYEPLFPEEKVKYIHLSRKEAEMVKYANNVMLTIQVMGANEISGICNSIDIDYNKIKEIMLMDERIGKNIDVPGPDGDYGFGGKCFPKDLRALTYLSREKGYEPNFLEEVWRSNSKFRKNKDWLNIVGATSENNDFNKKD